MTTLPDTKPWYGVTQKQAYERGLWAAPEGYALVPIQPTQAMCQAGQYKAREWPSFPLRIAPIWQSMIAAAPTHEETNHE